MNDIQLVHIQLGEIQREENQVGIKKRERKTLLKKKAEKNWKSTWKNITNNYVYNYLHFYSNAIFIIGVTIKINSFVLFMFC